MSDLDDYRLDSEKNGAAGSAETAAGEAASAPLEPPAGPPPEPPAGERSSPPVAAILAVIAALVLIAIGYFWFFGRRPPAPVITPTTESEPTAPRPRAQLEEEPIEDEELPALDASDAIVRRLVSGLSENPQLASWLVNEDLARRFVVAVDNLAEGVAPRPHIGFLAPRGDFEVASEEPVTTIDEASYRRYDLLTAVFTSLDTEDTVRLYRRLEPLLQQAYVELGYPNRDFSRRLRQALEVIVETPRPPADPRVVRGVKSYEYADPRLEGLPSAQKQLLRLGPENLERVQAKAAELVVALGDG